MRIAAGIASTDAGGLPPIEYDAQDADAPVDARDFERRGHVIGCGHVSGLAVAALHIPRACMEMRGSGADQICELVAP
ncbi:hypothetical protein X769_32585 [Mesorhizobium sp. LSJC268A00]|nr:hypothetical protein X769_32585 [Mesorhizobium sp. LSJC268A00]